MYLIGNNQNSVLVVLSKKDVCRLGVVLVYRDKIKIKIINIGVWLTASTLADKKKSPDRSPGASRWCSDPLRPTGSCPLPSPGGPPLSPAPRRTLSPSRPSLEKTEKEKRYATRHNNGVLFMTEERQVFDVLAMAHLPPPPFPPPSPPSSPHPGDRKIVYSPKSRDLSAARHWVFRLSLAGKETNSPTRSWSPFASSCCDDALVSLRASPS